MATLLGFATAQEKKYSDDAIVEQTAEYTEDVECEQVAESSVCAQ